MCRSPAISTFKHTLDPDLVADVSCYRSVLLYYWSVYSSSERLEIKFFILW